MTLYLFSSTLPNGKKKIRYSRKQVNFQGDGEETLHDYRDGVGLESC